MEIKDIIDITGITEKQIEILRKAFNKGLFPF